MIKIRFTPDNIVGEAPGPRKILAVGLRAKAPIRYGCSSCRCGTCAVKITPKREDVALSEMQSNEKELLEKIGLPLDGTVRLACQTILESGELEVDLDFQHTYSPDEGLYER